MKLLYGVHQGRSKAQGDREMNDLEIGRLGDGPE